MNTDYHLLPELEEEGAPMKATNLERLKTITSSEESYPDDERLAFVRQKIRSLETDRLGVEKYYELRSAWSAFLRWLLAVMVLFQFLVTGMIGLEVMDFLEYKTFLYAILVENFLQIVGMAFIVVTFLFPNGRNDENRYNRREQSTVQKKTPDNLP